MLKLREEFACPTSIQLTRHISQHLGCRVGWETPLGLPVVQPYTKLPRGASDRLDWADQQQQSPFSPPIAYSSPTAIHARNISAAPTSELPVPNTTKQVNAFPPNFVHSLDSCHMMLTALHCLREGITFASVHDCFWTHAATVEQMNRVSDDYKRFTIIQGNFISVDTK